MGGQTAGAGLRMSKSSHSRARELRIGSYLDAVLWMEKRWMIDGGGWARERYGREVGR